MYVCFLLFKFILSFTVLFLIADTVYQYSKMEKTVYKRNVFKFSSPLYTLFRVFPVRFAEYIDSMTSKEFHESGLIIYCGEQGSGKTYCMTHEINKLFCIYPDIKILTNYDLMIQDKCLDTWQPLLYEKNGDSGIVFSFDEISLWFNSRFRDLPPEVLPEVVQNRKNHRVIFGTAQNICMVDKQIRLQATEYRNCHTWFGFLSWYVAYRPVFDFEGNLIDKKFLGIKCYIQDNSIRYQYDTFSTVKRLGKLGFNYEKPVDININLKGENNDKKTLFKRNIKP